MLYNNDNSFITLLSEGKNIRVMLIKKFFGPSMKVNSKIHHKVQSLCDLILSASIYFVNLVVPVQ